MRETWQDRAGRSWEERRRRGRRRERAGAIRVRGLRVLIGLLSRLSIERATALGRACGRMAFFLSPSLRRRTVEQVRRALGDRHSAGRCREIALRSVENLGAGALEWTVCVRLGPDRAVRAVTGVTGWEHFERAHAAGKGVIIATAHFGLFELMPVWFTTVMGVAGKVVGRKPSHSDLEGLLVGARRSMNVETVHQQGVRELLRTLRRGEVVGLLPDQDVDKLPGLFVPFFSRPAWTVVGPANLSIATGAPIVPAFMHRTGPGRHRIIIRPPIEDPGGPREERVRRLTTECSRCIESEIAARPEQWAWIHERWKTTPGYLERRRVRRAKREARLTRKARRAPETTWR